MGHRELQSDDPSPHGAVPGLDLPRGYWDTVAEVSVSSPAPVPEVPVPSPAPVPGGRKRGARWRRPAPTRRSRWAWACWSVAGAAVVLALLSVPTVLGMARACASAEAGARAAEQGLAAMAAGEYDAAGAAFDRSLSSLRTAEDRLTGRGTPVGLAIPGLSRNLEAFRALVGVGIRLATAGAEVARASEDPVEARQDNVPAERIRKLTPSWENAERALHWARSELATLDSPLVAPGLRRSAREVDEVLSREVGAVTRGVAALRLLPGMLGVGGPRHYFVAFQNNAEMRGTGGLIGNWGELVGENGVLRLERFGRAAELVQGRGEARVRYLSQRFLARWDGFHVDQAWQQVNVSPDFPTVGRIISDLYPQSGGRPVDGVIGIDVPGLAHLLTVTGPVDVPGWPGPITAQSLVHVVLREAYERFPVREEREAFLDTLTRRAWSAITSRAFDNPRRLIDALGAAVREGHLAIFMQRENEQALMSVLGADGAVPRVESDSIMLVNQNIAANKVDPFLERRVHYEVRLQPGPHSAAVTGKLQVSLANRAPTSDLSPDVLGPFDARFQTGENRTYLSVYSPLRATQAVLDGGVPVGVDSQRDLGRQAHSTVLSLLPQQSRSVELDLDGQVQLRRGWYVLDVIRQPSVTADVVEISVTVPRGWRIAKARGLALRAEREASGSVPVVRDHAVRLHIERVATTSLPQEVVDRVRSWLGREHPAACLVRSRSTHEADC